MICNRQPAQPELDHFRRRTLGSIPESPSCSSYLQQDLYGGEIRNDIWGWNIGCTDVSAEKLGYPGFDQFSIWKVRQMLFSRNDLNRNYAKEADKTITVKSYTMFIRGSAGGANIVDGDCGQNYCREGKHKYFIRWSKEVESCHLHMHLFTSHFLITSLFIQGDCWPHGSVGGVYYNFAIRGIFSRPRILNISNTLLLTTSGANICQ